MNRKVVEFDVKGWIENSRVVGQDGQELPHNWDIRGGDCSEHVPILTARSTTFLARATPPVGALKKPPGATWVHLGPPGRERATDIDIHLVHTVRSTPQVDFRQIGRPDS